MRVILKHNDCKVKEDKAVLLVDIEQFYAFLDTVSPAVLAEYLRRRMQPKVKVELPKSKEE